MGFVLEALDAILGQMIAGVSVEQVMIVGFVLYVGFEAFGYLKSKGEKLRK